MTNIQNLYIIDLSILSSYCATDYYILINVLRKVKMATKTVNISFPEQTLDEIDKFAKKEALSRSDVLRIGAKRYIRSKSNWEDICQWGQNFAKQNKISPNKVDKVIAKKRYGAS